jgi:hypothetical protein
MAMEVALRNRRALQGGRGGKEHSMPFSQQYSQNHDDFCDQPSSCGAAWTLQEGASSSGKGGTQGVHTGLGQSSHFTHRQALLEEPLKFCMWWYIPPTRKQHPAGGR